MIVEVGVDGARDDEEFFVISFHLLVDVFAEVAGMGFFSMDEEDGCLDFIGVDIDRPGGSSVSHLWWSRRISGCSLSLSVTGNYVSLALWAAATISAAVRPYFFKRSADEPDSPKVS